MEWINVKDRLPDYEKEVLFVNGKDEVSVGVRFPYQKDVDIWATEDSIYFNDSLLEEWATCKFWIPFPTFTKERL